MAKPEQTGTAITSIAHSQQLRLPSPAARSDTHQKRR